VGSYILPLPAGEGKGEGESFKLEDFANSQKRLSISFLWNLELLWELGCWVLDVPNLFPF
jgi:hypothetical protein